MEIVKSTGTLASLLHSLRPTVGQCTPCLRSKEGQNKQHRGDNGMKSSVRWLLGTLITALVCLPAWADPVLDFGLNAPTPGVISYAGGAKPLVGKNIQVDNVLGLSTPAHDNTTVNIIGGLLNFTSGNFSGMSTTPSAWNFSGGGTITLTGCADLDHDGGVCDAQDASGTLLTGTFDNVTVLSMSSTSKILGAGVIDIKNPALAEFFGLPFGTTDFYSGGLNLSFKASGLPPHSFRSSVALSGDVFDSPPVPEPASLVLLGGGLLLLSFVTRKVSAGLKARN